MDSTIIDGTKLTWFGHASFLIETETDKAIYIDPYVLPANPKKADLILITHDHYDHCANVDKIAKEETIIVTTQKASEKISGVENIKIVKPGDSLEVEGFRIEAVHSYNPAKKFHPKGVGVGFVIEIAGKRIYHAGDTDLIPEMSELKNITVALLPIGGTYTMDAFEAAEAAKKINPEIVIPMHYGKSAELELPANPEDIVEALKDTKIEVRIL